MHGNTKYRNPVCRSEVIRIRGLGLSFQACADAIGCTVKTLAEWRKADPELEAELRKAYAAYNAKHAETVAATSDAKVSLAVLRAKDDGWAPKEERTVKVVLELPSLLPPAALDPDWPLMDTVGELGMPRVLDALRAQGVLGAQASAHEDAEDALYEADEG